MTPSSGMYLLQAQPRPIWKRSTAQVAQPLPTHMKSLHDEGPLLHTLRFHLGALPGACPLSLSDGQGNEDGAPERGVNTANFYHVEVGQHATTTCVIKMSPSLWSTTRPPMCIPSIIFSAPWMRLLLGSTSGLLSTTHHGGAFPIPLFSIHFCMLNNIMVGVPGPILHFAMLTT